MTKEKEIEEIKKEMFILKFINGVLIGILIMLCIFRILGSFG